MKFIPYIFFAAVIIFAASCSKDNSGTNAQTNGFTSSGSPGTAESGAGQGGSLARFTIAEGHLYVVDNRELHTYTLADPAAPVHTSTQTIGFDIETIYSYKDKLFIGSQTAMYIYSIADASRPAKLGEASHVRACDPVVANDNVAYVTVREGTTCGGGANALYVYDITNLMQPRQKNVIPLESPWGLGMTNDRLFVCNGASGMTVLDITQAHYPKVLQKITDATYYDVIVYDDLLICMIEGGTLLYEIQSDGQIVKMGQISS